MRGNKKRPASREGSRQEDVGSSAVTATVAFDASLKRRLKHPLDFRAESQLGICAVDAVVVAGRGYQRPDQVHDVDHAFDPGAVIHQHRSPVFGVVGRESFVPVEASFILGIDLPDGHRYACAVCAASLNRSVEIELQPVIWKLTGADQLCVRPFNTNSLFIS